MRRNEERDLETKRYRLSRKYSGQTDHFNLHNIIFLSLTNNKNGNGVLHRIPSALLRS
jgi:hypothetical protein